MEKNLRRYRRSHPDNQPPEFVWAKAPTAERFELRDGFIYLRGAPPEPWLRVELGRMLRAMHFRGKEGQVLTGQCRADLCLYGSWVSWGCSAWPVS